MNAIIIPFQLIILIFLSFTVSRAALRLKEGSLALGNFLFWLGLWTLVLFAIFRPEFSTYLASILGIGRGSDAIVYISILLIFTVGKDIK